MKRLQYGHVRSIFVATAAFALMGSPSADASGKTGDLLRQCENFQSGFCSGYIAGFYDGRTTEDYGMHEFKACFPVEEGGLSLAVSFQQMVLVFIKWARDHPEFHHWDTWQGVRQAFADAFPCKK